MLYNPELDEHFGDDGEEGGFDHGATVDAFINGDDFVEFFYLLALVEAVEEKFYLVLKFGWEAVALGAWHTRTGTGADGDELLGLGADFFELFFLLGGIDRAFDEGDIEFIEDVLGLEDARVTDVQNFAPLLEMVVHEFGKNHGAVFATREREPADAEFFLVLFHNADMVA